MQQSHTPQRKRDFAWVTATAIATGCFALALGLRGAVNLWACTGAVAVVAIAAAAWADRRALVDDLQWSRRNAAIGLLGGLLMAASTGPIYEIVAAARPALRDEVRALYATLDAPPGVWWALSVLVVVVAAEELVWRGMVWRHLTDFVAPPLAMAVSVSLYALPHLAGGSLVLLAAALLCGTAWTIERALTGSVVAPLLTHLVWDVLLFAAFPLE